MCCLQALALALVHLAILLAPGVGGATFLFLPAPGGNNTWETSANWNPAGIPTSADDVIIPPAPVGSYTVTINSQATCKTLSLGGPTSSSHIATLGPATTQSLIVKNTLAISGNCTVYQSGVLDVHGASLSGLSPTGTTVVVRGGLLFSNGGTNTVSTIGIEVLSGGYLSIADEPNGVILSNYASITVGHGGNLTLACQYGINNEDNTIVSMVNYGNFYGAPTSVTEVSVPFQNYGNFYVLSGQVLIGLNSTWHGTLTVASSSAALNITGGVHQFFADSNIQGTGTLQVQNDASVTLRGSISISYFVLTLGGAAVLVDSSPTASIKFPSFVMLGGSLDGTPGSSFAITTFMWAGGFVSVDTLFVDRLQIAGAFSAPLTNTLLNVLQQASFGGPTHLLLFNSTFALNAGAVMAFDDDIFVICDKNDAGSALIIGGSLAIKYPKTTTVTCNLLITATGTLTTTAGSLDVQTPISSGGSLNIIAPSVVILETTATFSEGSSIAGDGTLNCQSCTAMISGTVNVGTINFPAGIITVKIDSGTSDYVALVQFFNQSGSSSLFLINNSPARLNFTVANLNFAGGNVTSNHNAQLDLQANFIISNTSLFTGAQPYLLTNLQLINYGATTFYGGSYLILWENSVIYNAPSGTMRVTGGSLDALQNDLLGYTSEIVNEGQFTVELGATAQLAIGFRNMGYLEVNGQVSITSGSFTQEATSSVSYIARAASMTLTNPGLFLGGTLKGFGLIDGSVTLSAGAALNIDDSSSLTISTFMLRGNGTLVVDVASASVLNVQSLCQIYGGNLDLYSDLPVASRQYASSPSVIGSGFNAVVNTLNTTFGFAATNTSAGLFAVVAPRPKLSTITPATGQAGTTVTLTGTDFYVDQLPTPASVVVLFHGIPVPATVATVFSIIAVAPPGAGTVSVAVMIDGRVSIQQQLWTYTPPAVLSVSPQSGPTIGLNLVTIMGSNFGEDASLVKVSFGLFGACGISQLNNTQIVCAVPPGVGANISVMVQTIQSLVSTSIAQCPNCTGSYSYYSPVLQSVYPSAIQEGDGASRSASSTDTTITVSGQNLASTPADGNITIQIGQYMCGNVTQVSLTSFTCVPPPSVTTNTGESTSSFPIKVDVAGQSSLNLTFKVFSNRPQHGSTTNHWWPLPWWMLVAAGGAVVIILAVGVAIGRAASGLTTTSSSTTTTARREYEPISTYHQHVGGGGGGMPGGSDEGGDAVERRSTTIN